MEEFHLAEFNIGHLMYPIDHTINKDFVDNLERINTLAENSPGFVWRMVDEEGMGAIGIQAFDDPKIIINLTVWEDINSLYEYTYASYHKEIFTRRREWFNKVEINYVMWWIPKGTIPTLEEARIKINHLKENGPSPFAFNFKQRYSIQDFLQTIKN